MRKTIIISLGGSLIVPDSIDTTFLRSFKSLVLSYVKKGQQFVLICGGGKTARKYQESYKGLIGDNQEMMDWIGIEATKLNAFFVKSIFEGYAHPDIIIDPTKLIRTSKPIIIAAGWKPGRSTDYDAVILARKFGSKRVVNMSNVDFVYDKDPRKSRDAKKFSTISWQEYRKLIGSKWEAGLNAPFDPIAAKEAQKSGISAIIIGRDLSNLGKVIRNKPFKGTIISN